MENLEKKAALNIEANDKGQVFIYEGTAPEVLPEKQPKAFLVNGTIGAVQEFLKHRVGTEQFKQEDCHILVDREKMTITLVFNERDEYKYGSVSGKLLINPKFLEFGINADKVWQPAELGLFIKMNKYYFTDQSLNMKLVNQLMHYDATISMNVKMHQDGKGNEINSVEQAVNSNLPEKFNLLVPIFKGKEADTIEVETFAKMDGQKVMFVLLSPGAQSSIEAVRNQAIDEQLAAIKKLASKIAIIEQ